MVGSVSRGGLVMRFVRAEKGPEANMMGMVAEVAWGGGKSDWLAGGPGEEGMVVPVQETRAMVKTAPS